MRRIDARIDNRDGRASRAGGDAPCAGCVDARQVPLRRKIGIVGRHGSSAGSSYEIGLDIGEQAGFHQSSGYFFFCPCWRLEHVHIDALDRVVYPNA
jgi:hypothetical protein